jgi:hypothetical protein
MPIVQLLQVYPEGANVNIQDWAFEDKEYDNDNMDDTDTDDMPMQLFYTTIHSAEARIRLHTFFDERA